MRSTPVVVVSPTFAISTAGLAAVQNGTVHSRSFKTNHTVSIDKNAKPGTKIRVGRGRTYQTCEKCIVYPKRTIAVPWTIRVEQPE